MIPTLYTPEEVAEKLKVTRRSVYAWLGVGKLRGLRAGDQWRVTEDQIMAFLQRCQVPKTKRGPHKRKGRKRG